MWRLIEDDHGLGARARAGRQPDHGLPGRLVPARRLRRGRRRRAPAGARGGAAGRRGRRPEGRPRQGVDGEAVRERGGLPLRRPLPADLRRPRLHAHQRGRALLPRAARGPDLGGHQRDPAPDRRPRARAPRGGARRSTSSVDLVAPAPPAHDRGRRRDRPRGLVRGRDAAQPARGSGYAGTVWGVNPGRGPRRTACLLPALAELPEAAGRGGRGDPGRGRAGGGGTGGRARLRRRGRVRRGLRRDRATAPS